MHKDKLGKQSLTTFLSRKFWIWKTNNWKVLINNTKGICFEVPENFNNNQALEAWTDYKKQMSL
jgi:hypothetical protein